MRGHMEEVLESLNREGVRHEAWYLCPGQPLCVIGLMDVDDADAAAHAMAVSPLSVDRIHRQFKEHWLRSGITPIQFEPGTATSTANTKCYSRPVPDDGIGLGRADRCGQYRLPVRETWPFVKPALNSLTADFPDVCPSIGFHHSSDSFGGRKARAAASDARCRLAMKGAMSERISDISSGSALRR